MQSFLVVVSSVMDKKMTANSLWRSIASIWDTEGSNNHTHRLFNQHGGLDSTARLNF
ncbi:hypothetical protein EV13_1658 [Prochlorococcus sp. MIT 0702]|nr:hypothetical protein EV13_1658 [Prochlorococcus sp. MIT 0702]